MITKILDAIIAWLMSKVTKEDLSNFLQQKQLEEMKRDREQ